MPSSRFDATPSDSSALPEVGGGIDGPVSVTVQNRGLARGNRTARVDIEVRTGKAFV